MSDGNGNTPPDELNYSDVAIGHFLEMAHYLGRGEQPEFREQAAWFGGKFVEMWGLIPEQQQRARLYSAIQQAILKLPEDQQVPAAVYCRVVPQWPDPAMEVLMDAFGEDIVKLAIEETENAPSVPSRPRPNLIPDVPIINPALDYAGGIVYIAQQMTTSSEEDQLIIQSRPMIFTSARDYFGPPMIKKANELRVLDTGVAIDKTLDRAARRWSLAAITRFLSDGGEVCPWDLYHRLERVYIERIWFAESGNYMILALYTLLSYVFPIFDAVPYLHFAGLPGTGKTHAARILAALSFNGHIEVDPTEASLFRTIEATRGLVVLDDQETGVTNRSHTENPFMTILKTGYKRGARVTRMERRGNEFVPLTFDVYGPKVITNVFGLEDILADRVIPILMREIPSSLQSSINTSPISQNESQPLIDDLFLFAMLHTPAIAKLANEQQTSHKTRTEEIFWPLYVLATYIDTYSPDDPNRSLLGELYDILDEKSGQRQLHKSDTPEAILRLALLNLLERRGQDDGWFSTREIEKEFYMLHSSPPDWYNDRWLGRNIGKVLKLRLQDKKRDTQESIVSRFDYKTGRELDETEVKRFTRYYVRREVL
jgi:hypothetical protein